MMQHLLDSVLALAVLRYRVGLTRGWSKSDWGLEVMLYASECDEVLEQWRELYVQGARS